MKELYFNLEGMSGVLMVASDDGLYEIDVEGKRFCFEFSERWGPNVVNRRGHKVKEPGPKHNFWKAVSLWANQGKRLGDDGLCVFERKPPMVCRKLGGRNVEVVSGDDCEIWPQPIIWIDDDSN